MFTTEIEREINSLKGKMKTIACLTTHVNEKFNTNFPVYRIQYRVDRLLMETFGQPDEDAFRFVELCRKDVSENGGYFICRSDRENVFESALYISRTMLMYSEKFLDVVIVDSTYKRNRFNLPLINLIGINNYGQNILLAFALLNNETKESYTWIFKNLKEAWRRQPDNYVCDQCPSIRYGKNFTSKSYLSS